MDAIGGERVVLRAARPDDCDELTAILAEPNVAEWWGHYDAARVASELDGSFVIEVDGSTVGWLQAHETTDPDFPSVAFDIALRRGMQGRAYGGEALRVAVRHFAAAGHHRFTIDPALDNVRAIRAYESIGFKPVGVLRAYERNPHGGWRDGLLMDLLVDELRV